MAELNERSLKNLEKCHPDLQRIARLAITRFDFTVTTGHRNEKDQTEAYNTGYSRLPWPKSRHNTLPSLAFDAAPNPIDYKQTAKFCEMREVFKQCADELGIEVRFISWDLP